MREPKPLLLGLLASTIVASLADSQSSICGTEGFESYFDAQSLCCVPLTIAGVDVEFGGGGPDASSIAVVYHSLASGGSAWTNNLPSGTASIRLSQFGGDNGRFMSFSDPVSSVSMQVATNQPVVTLWCFSHAGGDPQSVLGSTSVPGPACSANPVTCGDFDEWVTVTFSIPAGGVPIRSALIDGAGYVDDLTLCVAGPVPTRTFCDGDGSAAACPCGNESSESMGEGCRNSTARGACLMQTGSTSVLLDDIAFRLTGAVGNQTSVLVQGSAPIALPFRDGILCMGSPTERIEVVQLDGIGQGSTSVSVVLEGGVGPGDTRYYQQWYRDPGGASPCGTGSNLSSGLIVTYQ